MWLCSLKNPARNVRASSREANDGEKSRRYFNVLNCTSEYGLSLETIGRESWELLRSRDLRGTAIADALADADDSDNALTDSAAAVATEIAQLYLDRS